jgi:hypothetical protein
MSKLYDKIKGKYPCLINVPWPKQAQVQIDKSVIYLTDPNEIIRPVLESELGKQGEAWDWCLCPTIDNFLSIGMYDAVDAVRIKLQWS